MAKNQTLFNSDKENSIFATRLRELFAEQKKSQKDLTDYIKENGQKKYSRQMVSNWTYGCEPNLKIIPIIADFFGVSTDYLLGRTTVKTPKMDERAVCDFTGLSQEAVEEFVRLRNYEDDSLHPYFYTDSDNHLQMMDLINILIGRRYETTNIDGENVSETYFSLIIQAALQYVETIYINSSGNSRTEKLLNNAAKWEAIEIFKDFLDEAAERIAKDLKGEQKQWQQSTDPNTTSTETLKVIE